MSKKNKSKQVKKTDHPTKGNSLVKLIKQYRNPITFMIIFILLIIVLKPMVFDGLRPGGVDVLGSMGATHQRKELRKDTGEEALWNSPVFSGMPIYHRLKGRVMSFDNVLQDYLGHFIFPYVLIYLVGFIGMFYLLQSLSLGYWASVFGALGFIFIPSYMSLLHIGHFAKFRPIMYIPLVTFFFISVMKKHNLLWLVGFIFAFSVQIRTQHYQIIFYQVMILLFIGIYYLINMIKAKETKQALVKIGLFAGASIIIIMMVAQPLFVTSEYTPYSIRGGTGEEGSSGLSSDYATRWSLNPAEMLVWIIPRAFGGTSQEMYTGNKVERLNGRVIPGYWGAMPFTQSCEYVGIVLLFIALIGLILNWKNGLVRTLFGLFILSMLLAFGRHFSLVYNLFFNYVPAFNKFRVPAMINVIMQIIVVIWAGFGLQSLLNIKAENIKKVQRTVMIIAIIFIVLGMIPSILSSQFSFTKAEEAQQYSAQLIPLLQEARMDMMQTDGIRLIVFTLIIFGLIYLLLKRKMKPVSFALIILILVCVDQIPFVTKAEGELSDPRLIEATHFKKTATDNFLLKDESYYRIYPITENPFNSNDWSYYHNSIGGYSAAKLRIYQDVIEFGLNPPVPFKWNLFKMLNTKYIISSQQLPGEQLELVFKDKSQGLNIYQLQYENKPAWFVDNIKVIDNREERFNLLKSDDLNVYETALLEENISINMNADSASVELKELSFNHLTYTAINKAPALLVISEIYYPKGWKCFIDGEETKIYKTNHALRSVLIEKPGMHEVKFIFEPAKFKSLVMISYLGHIIAWMLLICLSLRLWLLKKKESLNG